jgi:hypothetical protein
MHRYGDTDTHAHPDTHSLTRTHNLTYRHMYRQTQTQANTGRHKHVHTHTHTHTHMRARTHARMPSCMYTSQNHQGALGTLRQIGHDVGLPFHRAQLLSFFKEKVTKPAVRWEQWAGLAGLGTFAPAIRKSPPPLPPPTLKQKE